MRSLKTCLPAIITDEAMSAGISASRSWGYRKRIRPLSTTPHRGEANRLRPERKYFFWPIPRIGIAPVIYCIAAVATLTLCAPRLAQAQQATGTIRAVVPKNFPPEYSLDKSGKPQGFAIDTMEAIAQSAGLKVTYQVEENWQNTLKALREGRAEIIPNLGVTDERLSWFDFTTPMDTFAIRVFIRKIDVTMEEFSDLTGHKVATVAENVAVRLLTNYPSIETIVYQEPERAMFALLSGEVDAFVYPEPVVWRLALAARIEDEIKVLGGPLLEIKRAIAVRKGNEVLLQRLEQAKRTVLASEEYRDIYARWHGIPPPFWTPTRMLYLTGSLFGLFLLLALGGTWLWRYRYLRRVNRQLEEQVRVRTRLAEHHAARLEATNKELEAFAYSVSHDLRAPLRAIDGFSQILLEEYEDRLDDEGRRLLKVVRENTVKMGQLINDILRLSRAGRMALAWVEVEMRALTDEVWEGLSAERGGCDIRLEIKPLPSACADRAALTLVLTNLLGNAIKFSAGRDPALIEVGGHEEGSESVYYVKDNGAGFDMTYADKLFGVFQRMHCQDEFAGSGIGLAIVKRLITLHGGRVWAEGQVDKGATFYFALPRPVQCGENSYK